MFLIDKKTVFLRLYYVENTVFFAYFQHFGGLIAV